MSNRRHPPSLGEALRDLADRAATAPHELSIGAIPKGNPRQTLTPDPRWAEAPPAEPGGVCVTVPIRTPNPTNTIHGHWSTAHKRATHQREAVALSLVAVAEADRQRLSQGCVVRLTRVSSGRLDQHNLGAALKHVIDSVAVFLFGGEPGQRDEDPRVTWELGQLKAPRGVAGVVVSIRGR